MPVRSPGASLPARPHPDWYRKAAKRKLAELRVTDPHATLSRVQLEIARAHGYSSWRALIAAIAAHQAFGGADTADGKTPLHQAAARNDRRSVEILLGLGADPEQRYGEAGHTALSWAVTLGAFDAAAALVEGGARMDLFCAAAIGDLASVRSFFDHEGGLVADAASTCRVRFLSSVIPRAWRPVNRDLASEAMYAAVRFVRVDVARFLVERGVDLASQAFLGATLLHWAYYSGSRPMVELLIARGADRDARDYTFGCTPRAFAICAPARLGLMDLVQQRLDEDPMLATINEGRGTPLHEASRARHEAIVRLLLSRGADPGARDEAGRTPGDLAGEVTGTWMEVLL